MWIRSGWNGRRISRSSSGEKYAENSCLKIRWHVNGNGRRWDNLVIIGILNSFSNKDRRPHPENYHIKMNTLDIFELQITSITFFRASNKFKHSSSNRSLSQQNNISMGSTNNINLDDTLSPSLRRKISGGGRESPIKMQ